MKPGDAPLKASAAVQISRSGGASQESLFDEDEDYDEEANTMPAY